MKNLNVLFIAGFIAFIAMNLSSCTQNEDIQNDINVDSQEIGINDFIVQQENNQARAAANNLQFTDRDFLQTKQQMSDETIAPFDYKTGLVGDKAYNQKVYVTALERVKRNMDNQDGKLVIKAKSGLELNMSEDLFEYIVNLISTWNQWIEEKHFEIVQVDNAYYDIEPTMENITNTRSITRANPINLLNLSTHNARWDAVKSVVDSGPIGTYLGDHFVLNFGQEVQGEFNVSNKTRRYYVCNGCATHGVSSPTCSYNYIASKVSIPDSQMNVYSLRNPSQLAIVTYQLAK